MYSIDDEKIKKLIEVERKSTCAAKHVCCLLVVNNGKDNEQVISSGYNKSVSNVKCTDLFMKANNLWYFKNDDGRWLLDCKGDRHSRWSIQHEVHAEIMALTTMTDLNNNNITAIVTWSPWLDCCKSLINAGITEIYYFYSFDNINLIEQLCKECNVKLEKLDGDNIERYRLYKGFGR